MQDVMEVSDSDDEGVNRAPRTLRRRRSWVAATHLGISPKEFRRLKRSGAPGLLFFLIHGLRLVHGSIPHDVDIAEMFSGAGHLVAVAMSLGLRGLTYEILEDKEHQDMCTALGFLQALLVMLRCVFQGLVHWDTCCSNWVWISRSKTGRCRANPMGTGAFENVQKANFMVSRMCLLQLVAASKFAIMMLEQPASSLMPLHRRMVGRPFNEMFRIFIHMGCYGALTAKPTVLYSNEMLVLMPLKKRLNLEQQRQMDNSDLVSLEYRDNGKLAVTGKSKCGGLKASQQYTKDYAEAVVGSWRRWREVHAPTVDEVFAESSDSDYSSTSDPWDDAELQLCAAMFVDVPGMKAF